MNKTILIRCRGLSKVFKKGDQEIRPLQKLDLDIHVGEFLVLMGPSGSGKTTLLNLLAGIDSASEGQLFFQDKDITKFNRRQLTQFRSKNIGYIFQLYHLVPVLTAYENVELPLLIHPMSKKERHQRVQQAMELANIADRATHYPSQLSGGQEQRVAIARALVTDPPLLVADEPTGDLDSDSAQRVLELLSHLCKNLAKTVVMVTHDPKAAAAGDRILKLEKGALWEDKHVAT